jgi:hypothetical protein
VVEGKLLWCRDQLALAQVAEDIFRRVPDERWLHQVGNAAFLEGLIMADMRVDKDRVTEFLRLMSDDLQDLREQAQVSKEVYLSDRNCQAIVERRLQTAIGSAVNIGNHLIARLAGSARLCRCFPHPGRSGHIASGFNRTDARHGSFP